MRRLFCTAALLALTIGGVPPALAADPTPVGDWLVKDGYADIRIDICAGRLWGIVAWEKKPGLDDENPDPAKRTRPTLGMPIIMGFVPVKPNRWEGEIYNSENGKMYSASVSMADDNTLNLEGCLFTNFMCQTQKWTRIAGPPPGAAPLPPIKGAPAKQTGAKKGTSTVSDTCMRIADEAAAMEKAAKK